MNGIAAFIMRGPAYAGAVAAAGMLLGLVLPPFAWLSAAVLALVALRLGPAALLRAAVPALLGIALLGGVLWGRPGALALAAVAAWLPTQLAALVLRRSVRLDIALLAVAAMGWLVVIVAELALADPAATWQQTLLAVFPPDQLATETRVSAEAIRQLIARMAPLMTGVLAASVVFSTVTSLLLARWWQAGLYNPGGFGREFRALRLGRVAAVVAAVLCGAALGLDVHAVRGLALATVALFVFQGLAVAHGVVARRGMASGWLVGLYVLALFLPPQVMAGLTLVGIADAWADFRKVALAG